MKYLINVCGPNGAGKTTFTKSILARLNLPVVDPDRFSSQGISQLASSRIALQQINEYLANGISFIKESTLSSNFDLKAILRARELGYKNILIYISLPDPQIAWQSVKRRVCNGGHDIPYEVILRRCERSAKNLQRIKNLVDKYFIIPGLQERYDPIIDAQLSEIMKKIEIGSK